MKKNILYIAVCVLLSGLYGCEKTPVDPNDTFKMGELNSTPSQSVVVTPTVATTETTSLTFYTKSTVYASTQNIFIYVDGNYAGTISTFYNSTPSCGQTGNVTTTVTVGAHTWYGTSSNGLYSMGSSVFPRSLVSSTVSCNRQEVVL